jgi:hypothetical protein
MSSLFFVWLPHFGGNRRGGAYDEIYGKLVYDRKSIRKIIINFF